VANATKTVKSSGGDYTSLNAALAGQAANLTTNCAGTGGAGILTIECYSMSDTTAANTGTGYTTSASYYINITVPTAERHDGKWNTAKYRINYSSEGGDALTIAANYTRVTGIQASQNGTYKTRRAIRSSNCVGVILDSCIGRIAGTNGAESNAFLLSSSTTYSYKVVNCIAINPLNIGFSFGEGASPTATVYNCTAISCATYGFYGYSGRALLKNCVAHSCGTSDFNSGMGATGSTNNASEDGSAPNTNEVSLNGIDLTDIFVDAANGDYHLVVDSPLINVGADLHSDTYAANTSLASSLDIDGETRSGTWDIGADEYVSEEPEPEVVASSIFRGSIMNSFIVR